jgi:hypothetical protein
MGSRLSSLLVQEGYLTLEALKDALALQVIKGGELDTILLEKRLLDEPTLLALLSRATGYPPMVPALCAGLEAWQAPVTLDVAVRLQICPLPDEGGALPILVAANADPLALEELAFELDRRLSPFAAPDVRIADARARIYGAPLAARAARLLERLGEAPLPADLRSSGVLELAPLTPTIEPRRGAPSLPAQALPEAVRETTPTIPVAEPLAPGPGAFEVLAPLATPTALDETPAAEHEDAGVPPAIPKDITDEFPPLRPRRITEPLGALAVAAPAPAPAAPAPTPAPAEPVTEEELPPVALGAPVDMPPIPADELESSGEREVEVAPEALVPEEESAVEPTPTGFGPDEVTPDEAPPSVVLGLSSPALPSLASSRPEIAETAPGTLEALAAQARAEAAALDTAAPSAPDAPRAEGSSDDEDRPKRVVEPELAAARVLDGAPAEVAAAPEEPTPDVAPPEVAEVAPEERTPAERPESPAPGAFEADPDAAPLALHDAVRAMHQAVSRDDLLLAFARGIHSLLECVQIYVLRPDHLQGHLELTAGRVDRSEVRRRKISLEQPSVVSRAVEDGALFIGPAPDTDASGATLIAAGILALRGLVLLPIHLKGKTICLIAGHDYDNPISQRLRVPLMELADEAAKSLASLILRQKQARGAPVASVAAAAPELSLAPEPALSPEPSLAEAEAEAESEVAVAAEPAAGLAFEPAAPEGDLPPAPQVPLEEPPQVPLEEPPLRRVSSGERHTPGVISGEIDAPSPSRLPSGDQVPRVVVEMPPAGFPFDVVKPVTPGETRSERETLRMPVSPRPAFKSTATFESRLAALEEGGNLEETLAELTAMGTPAIRELIARFPGRLRFDRFAPRAGLPPVGECSAVLRALCAFGRGVLLHIPPLFHHPDAEVRFYATYLMSELVYPEGVALLATRLGDPDPETRRIAAQILRRFKEMEQFPGVLLDLRSDLTNPDPRPRRAAIEALAALGDSASVWVLADLLEDADFGVREAALNALVSLTKQDFGPSARRWQTWWERNEHRHRIEWLIDGLVHKAPEIRASAAADLLEITGLSFGYSFDMPRRDREAVRRRFVDWWAETGQQTFAASS